jgi:catechol 2,3-dioxygenase-like lactoylglutathione lyase family enzyme
MFESVYTTLPVSDLERAKRFYSEKLGLTPEREVSAGVFYLCGGTRFFVFPSEGKPSGTHTQMDLRTADIEAAVAELKARGVVFEEYDMPGIKTVNSVATFGNDKVAWFKDSQGNLLSIAQFD